MKLNWNAIAENTDKYLSRDDWYDQIGSKAVSITEDEAEGLEATYWDEDHQEEVTITLRQKNGGWGWWGGRYGTDQIYHNGWSTPAGAMVAAWKFFTNFEVA